MIDKIREKISLVHIVLAIITIYVIATFINQEIAINNLNKKNELADIELKGLKYEIKDLEKKIDKSNKVEYIEKIAREEFDMIKPHELIYRDKKKLKTKSFSD